MAKVVYKKYSKIQVNSKYRRIEAQQFPGIIDKKYENFVFITETGIYEGKSEVTTGNSGIYSISNDGRYLHITGTNGRSDQTWTSIKNNPVYGRGDFIQDVIAEDGTYPHDGMDGNYWYVWDRYANRAPVITGSNTNLGHQNKDFSITYRVSDEDNDEVKVDVMVDGKVIQYPMAKALDQSHSVPIRIEDYGLGDHTITVTATDTNNASASRTYYFTKSNTAPTISGSDMDLGAKFEDFQVDYLVQDAEGNDVSVEIKVDGTIKQSSSKSTLGVRRYFTIAIKDYEIGRHTIEIKATDSNGASTVRAYTFNKVNSAPAISGQDENLGAKNTAFSYTYTVTDRESDNIDVIEKVNGEVIRVLNNATLGSEYRITITDEQIRQLELNASNTIEIEATDGTATSFRRVTFIRNNMPPIIADRDKDLGNVTNSFEYSWSATDPEKDKMNATIYLDDRILKDRHSISEGANQTIKIDGMDMFKIDRGKHTIRIVVEDDKGFSSIRTLTFTRVVDKLVMKLAGKGIETDGLAKRVLISTAGIHVAKGADVKYEVCNNSFDDSPTWEDATAMTMANKAFNFTNKDKVAEKAGVDIKVTITRGDAKGQSYISAIGGSFD